MNNLEILERFIHKPVIPSRHHKISYREIQAIENLIQENKELKEKINKSIEFINDDDTFFVIVKVGKMYFI